MVLLFGLCSLTKELNLVLEVAHVDHRLRPTSESDAQFVSQQAEKAGLKFHLRTLSSAPEGVNTEAWARSERYQFFSELIGQRRLDFVVTAHQANDVAETLLMRLLSNKEPRTILRLDPQRKCLRPLLSVERSAIEEYQQAHSIQFVEDPTNQDILYLRNRVRHQLLPFLIKEFNPSVVGSLAHQATSISEDISLLDSLATEAVPELELLGWGTKAWFTRAKSALEKLHPALQWRLVQGLLKPKLCFNLGSTHCQELVAFFLGSEVAYEIPGGFRLERREGGLQLVES